jgi:hypothetical protein
MAYSDFTIEEVIERFSLKYSDSLMLFSDVQSVAISSLLQQNLQRGIKRALDISTEKARSEFIIAPILLELGEVEPGKISLFSGSSFNVAPEEGLYGICDFIISKSNIQTLITAPVLMIVEAKNENIPKGLGQCSATMIAAQKFNDKRKNLIPTIYGAVTTGDMWRFLKLEGDHLYVDKDKYYIQDVEKIFGILLDITGLTLAVAA